MQLEKAYDLHLDWQPNLERSVNIPPPELPPRDPTRNTILGFPLNSLFGISACPLTVNSCAVELHSRLGFDLLTYKSVRSTKWRGNKFPHWLYVDAPVGMQLSVQTQLVADFEPFPEQEVSMTNSFGIHSAAQPTWQEDYRNALSLLLPGQLLILSVQTTPIEGKTIIADAKDLAKAAKEAGAPIVEINFACPNTEGGKGMVFEDNEKAIRICYAMKDVLGDIPLLVKVGFYENQENARQFMKQTRGIISGISTANTFSAHIIGKDGSEIFPGRPTAGVSGAVIRQLAMEQARQIVNYKNELGLTDFVVIGIGGVTQTRHIQAYLDLGVDAVQSAVGAYSDPYLAQKYLESL